MEIINLKASEPIGTEFCTYGNIILEGKSGFIPSFYTPVAGFHTELVLDYENQIFFFIYTPIYGLPLVTDN